MGGDAELMVGLFVLQLVKGLFLGNDSRKVEVDRIEDFVVGNAAFDNVKCGVRQSFATGCYEIKPFFVVGSKYMAGKKLNVVIWFIDIEDCRFVTVKEPCAIFDGLTLEQCHVEAHPEV